jgi:hypothetical protein
MPFIQLIGIIVHKWNSHFLRFAEKGYSEEQKQCKRVFKTEFEQGFEVELVKIRFLSEISDKTTKQPKIE